VVEPTHLKIAFKISSFPQFFGMKKQKLFETTRTGLRKWPAKISVVSALCLEQLTSVHEGNDWGEPGRTFLEILCGFLGMVSLRDPKSRANRDRQIGE